MENHSDWIVSLSNKIKIYKRNFPNSKLLGIVFKIHLNYSRDDGVPHLLEHLLVHKSTVSDYVKIEGSTSTQSISIRIISTASASILALKNIIDQIENFSVTQSQLIDEKKVVIQEAEQYRFSSIEKFAIDSRHAAFDSNNKTLDTVLGSSHSLNGIQLEDLNAFIKKISLRKKSHVSLLEISTIRLKRK